MKKLTLVLTLGIVLVSCNTYNAKMNNLLSEKAKLENEYSFNKTKMNIFASEQTHFFNTELYEKHNFDVMKSDKYKQSGDSAQKYATIAKGLKYKLDATNYSIDSLSKLK